MHLQLLFVIAAMAATFLLVPRGFSAGEIDIQSDHMSWNTTKGTYQLNLLARIPINNPNFLNVSHGCISAPFLLVTMVLTELHLCPQTGCGIGHSKFVQAVSWTGMVVMSQGSLPS